MVGCFIVRILSGCFVVVPIHGHCPRRIIRQDHFIAQPACGVKRSRWLAMWLTLDELVHMCRMHPLPPWRPFALIVQPMAVPANSPREQIGLLESWNKNNLSFQQLRILG